MSPFLSSSRFFTRGLDLLFLVPFIPVFKNPHLFFFSLLRRYVPFVSKQRVIRSGGVSFKNRVWIFSSAATPHNDNIYSSPPSPNLTMYLRSTWLHPILSGKMSYVTKWGCFLRSRKIPFVFINEGFKTLRNTEI